MCMANSYVDIPGDGSTTIFNIPFGFLDRSHVNLYVDGVQTAYTWVGSASVSVAVAPSTGAIVRIARKTPSAPVVDFKDGEALTETDLDRVNLQSLYLAQESADDLSAVLQTADSGQFDAENKRIQNLQDPVDAQDAVTKQWAETGMTSQLLAATNAKDTAVAQADVATTKAAEASASASAAATSESNASASESNAASSASAAATSESNASTSESNAAGSASAAATSASNAASSAAAAATSESNAASSASSAATHASAVSGAIGNPVGTVITVLGDTAPTGYLKLNGAIVSASAYSDLANYLQTNLPSLWSVLDQGDGTFQLPDWRGEFARFWDDGRGVDAGRGVGTWQDGEIEGHQHVVDPPATITDWEGNHQHSTLHTAGEGPWGYGAGVSGTYITTSTSAAYNHALTSGEGGHNHTVDIAPFNSGSTGGAETRPRNVALLACIKY